MEPLRILTINTGKGDGPYEARLEWLVEEARRIRPDVIACQEAFQNESGEMDTAAKLANELNLHCFWTPARLKQRTCDGSSAMSWSGMALLSRQPWTLVDALDLPSDARDGDRVAQFAMLEGERVRLVIANVHLTHLRNRDDLRRDQLKRVLSHGMMQAGNSIRLICGDFNTMLDGPVLGELLGRSSVGHLQDAFAQGGGRSPRATLPSRGDGEGACVDFILSLADAPNKHPVFTSSAVVFNNRQPGSDIYPSDHFGVATTMVPLPVGSWLKQERRELV